MPRGVASPKQIAMMKRVLDAYCGALGITDELRREELAFQIVALFDKGFRDESSLRAALTKSEGDNDGGPSGSITKRGVS